MKRHILFGTAVLGLMTAVASCSGNEEADPSAVPADGQQLMHFEVQHPGTLTRATSTSFEAADQVGIFLTGSQQTLDVAGNELTNVPLTFDGTQWAAPTPLYWNSGTYDVYAYYPYRPSVPTVTDLPFSVATEQQAAGGYEASDFLWTRSNGVEASAGAVNLQFAHRMSRLQVQLAKGEDYEGDLPDEAEVYVHSTVTDGTIDLSAGVVTPDRHAASRSIHARSLGNHRFAALVIPQRIDNRVPLIEVVSHGVSYLYESKFLFKTGIQHNVLLVLSNNPEQIKIQVGGEVQNW